MIEGLLQKIVVALFLLGYYRGIMMVGGFSVDESLIKITTTGR